MGSKMTTYGSNMSSHNPSIVCHGIDTVGGLTTLQSIVMG